MGFIVYRLNSTRIRRTKTTIPPLPHPNPIRIMKFTAIYCFAFCLIAVEMVSDCCAETPTFSATDWPWWRGQDRNGVAEVDQNPPLAWSEDQNILWRTPVPGRGHGSATVLGENVFLPIADEDRKVQAILCFDRDTGKRKWECIVHEGGFDNQGNPNKKSSLASSTIATDNDRLFITFVNDSAVWASATDLNGKLLWQQKISDYVIHQGYGSSPAIYEHLVIVSADNKGGGAIAGLNRQTGKIEWSRSRPNKPNYPSPVILQIDGRDQLIFIGCDLVTSLDPLTGKELWEFEGATTECVTSTVTDGKHIFSSGGYPKNHIAAVVADGSGKVTWETNTRAYVPSLLQKDGYIYATLDAGVAICFRCSDGKEMWKGRLGGTFSSSPVMVGDLIYGSNEEGQTFIFKAKPSAFELVSQSKLGDDVFATPTICGGRIYTRVAFNEGAQRQEYLICIGN